MSFEYPFVFFGSFGVKYLFIIFYLILGAMIITLFLNRKAYKIKWSSSKSNIVKVLLTYTLLMPFYWWDYLTNNQMNILTVTCKWIISLEFIFAVILLLAIGYGMTIYTNKETYFNALILPITVILYIDILSLLVIRQVDLLKWYNLLLFLTIGLFIGCINNFRFEKVREKVERKPETKSYLPINKIEDLFVQRKWQALELENLINNNSIGNEPFSICISGEWGRGKTSFVNAVMKNIEENTNSNHKVIWINTMDMDSVESLFEYLFQKIKNVLQNEGFYVGISSEYQNYVSSVIEIISKAKISSAVKNLFGKEKDYRKTKKHLEEMLHQMLDGNKLIIIIDDIERCDSNKIGPFIKFIKEIATFENCITIFLTDYDQLNNSLEGKPIKYLDKFFNHRINLIKVNYYDIIKHFLNRNTYKFELYNNIEVSILNELDKFILEFQKEILNAENSKNKYSLIKNKEKEEEEYIKTVNSKIHTLNNNISFIEDNLNNPRNIVKLLSYVEEYCLLVKDNLSNKDPDTMDKYLNKVEAQKNIIIIALIRTILQEKYEMIQNLGINSYVDYLCDVNSVKDSEDEFINCLVIGVWHKNRIYNTRSKDYQQYEIIKFLTSLLENPSDLINIVHGFASYDDKYITMLKNDEELDIDIIEVFKIVVRNFSYQDYAEGSKLIKKVFFKIKLNRIISVFTIFNSGVERQFTPRLHIMRLFYDFFCGEDIIFENVLNEKKQLRLFSRNYVPEGLNNLAKSFYFHVIDKETDIVKIARDKAWNGKSFDEILNIFCAEMDKHFASDESIHINKIVSYLNKCKEELIDFGLMEMDDIKNEIERAFAQVEEFEYLYKIINFIDEKSVFTEKVELKDINYNNIQKTIDSVITELKNGTFNKTQPYETMSDFFNIVKDISKDKVFSDDLIKNLHNLITVFRDSFKDSYQGDVFYYRKVMVDIQRTKKYNVITSAPSNIK